MKASRVASLLTIGLVLALSATGCRKGPQKTTNIPGVAPRHIGDDGPNKPIELAPTPPAPTPTLVPQPIPTNIGAVPPIPPGPTGTDITGTKPALPPGGVDIAATDFNFDNWIENRDEFKNQTVYFDFDKSNIKPGEVGKLEEVARRMKNDFKGKALRIEGHCDERGTEEYNRSLGDRRAGSVREKLAALGLDPKMLPTISFGEEKPVDPSHNEGAWSRNRRGELILLSPPGAN